MSAAAFADHVSVVHALLAGRERICENIERRLLNVGGKAAASIRDRAALRNTLDACVFTALAEPSAAAARRDELAAAHLADGFEPLFSGTHAHQLDPADLIVHACEQWERSRWPGANGRLRYARAIYAVIMLRHLQDLVLRIWDEGDDSAAERLGTVQRLLQDLNGGPVTIVRDARWLLHTALGPLTKGLAPYFRVAERMARTFTGGEGIALHAAGAKLAAGHLRSQLHARAGERGRPADSAEVLAVARNSNAMDLALLVCDLVPLLEAYRAAPSAADESARLPLASAIVQGWSADPELLLARVDLLVPYTMIETVFVQAGGFGPIYTPLGERHVLMLARYASLVDELAPRLAADARACDPAATAYSPFAMVYGFVADVMSKMARQTLSGISGRDITVEDLFDSGGDAAQKRAAADCSADWAGEVFARTMAALELRVAAAGRANATNTRSASLRVSSGHETVREDRRSAAQEHCVTSDVTLAMALGATAFPRGHFALDRQEGRFLASAEADGRWFGISKTILSAEIAEGRDAEVVGVPDGVRQVLALTWPGLGAKG